MITKQSQMWMFKDKWKRSQVPRYKERVENHLRHHKIEADGYLQQALHGEWPVLRYLSYVAQTCPDLSSVRKKITRLAKLKRKGKTSLDEEINTEVAYSAALFELKAIYALCHLMGFKLVDCDVKVGGAGPHSKKDCDLVVKKNKSTLSIRIDAKRASHDTLSLCENRRYSPMPKEKEEERSAWWKKRSARWKIGEWLKEKIRKVSREKHVHILVVHLPVWEQECGFSERKLRQYSQDILPGVLTWTGNGPVWSWQHQPLVKQIVVVGSPGCWKITCVSAKVRRS